MTASIDVSRAALLGTGRSADVFEWQPGWVLKLFHADVPRSYAQMEVHVARAVYETVHGGTSDAADGAAFRVPAVGDLIDVGERVGLSYARVQGGLMTRACVHDDGSPAWERIGERLAQLHLAIHRIDPEDLEKRDTLDVFPTQAQRLNLAIQTAAGLSADHRIALLAELEELQALEEPVHVAHSLCHGDFHPFNVLQDARGVATVIDWAAAERGIALCDVAKTSLRIQFAPVAREAQIDPAHMAIRRALHDAYLDTYFASATSERGHAAYMRWLPLAAAARLVEGAGAAEHATLLALIGRCLAR
jgi:Ser/Thr protein kinase RdoA (MazF antagonist)